MAMFFNLCNRRTLGIVLTAVGALLILVAMPIWCWLAVVGIALVLLGLYLMLQC